MFNTPAILETRPRHEMYLGNESFVLVETGMSDNGDGNAGTAKKSTGLLKQQLCTYITLCCAFLCRRCTTTTRKYLISRCVEDVNTVDFLFFPEL